MQDFLVHWHSALLDPERIPYALAAVLLTVVVGMITGPLAGNANPFLWIVLDKIFGELGDRLDRTGRERGDLVFRGFLLSALVIFCAMAAGRGFDYFIAENNAYGLSEVLILSLLITSGSVWFALLRLYFAQEKEKSGQKINEGAYFAIARSMRRNLTAGDDFGITRCGMGFAARSFDKGLASPVFWYLLGGLPLALVYAVLAGLAWRFGKDGFSKGFGAVPLALERLLGFVPSAFAAVIITMAAVATPTAKTLKAIAAWTGVKSRAPYEQGGLPLSAMAWALNINLGGACQDVTGSAIKGEWTGPEGSTAKVGHKHLRRGIFISVVAHIIFLATLCGAYLWGGGVDFSEVLDF